MDHRRHAPGTGVDCAACRTFAYEPGWYRAMRDPELAAAAFGMGEDLDDLLVVVPEAEGPREQAPAGGAASGGPASG